MRFWVSLSCSANISGLVYLDMCLFDFDFINMCLPLFLYVTLYFTLYLHCALSWHESVPAVGQRKDF